MQTCRVARIREPLTFRPSGDIMHRAHRGTSAAVLTCLLGASSAFAEPAPTSRYTKFDLKPPVCRSDPGPAEGFSCAGLDGWRALVGFPAVGASVTLVRTDRGGDVPELLPGDGQSLTIDGLSSSNSPVEWRGGTRGGRFVPRAAILRVTVLDPQQRQETIESGRAPARPKRGQVLLVYRLTLKGACRIAYVDAGANADANDLAREAADVPGDCPVRQVAVHGKSSPILEGNIR